MFEISRKYGIQERILNYESLTSPVYLGNKLKTFIKQAKEKTNEEEQGKAQTTQLLPFYTLVIHTYFERQIHFDNNNIKEDYSQVSKQILESEYYKKISQGVPRESQTEEEVLKVTKQLLQDSKMVGSKFNYEIFGSISRNLITNHLH